MSSAQSKGRPAGSIEGRLVLLLTGGATLLLIGISGVLYVAIGHYMDRRMDAFLESIVADTAGDLDEADGVADVAREIAVPGPEEPPYWLRILDANQSVAVETKGMSRRVPVTAFPLAQAAGTTRRDMTGADGRWISLAARGVTAHGARYTIQVAEDRRTDADFLREFRWILGALTVGGIVIAGALASIVSRSSLRPLRAMEEAISRIGSPQLAQHLGTRPWPRELAPLALAFDEMMDRLRESFLRLSQFSADLAHELRTPIANLRGEAEVVLGRPRAAGEYRQVLESSLEEYGRLAEIISKLLFLARAEAEETQPKLEEIDAASVIDALLEFYAPYAEELRLTVRRSGDALLKADAILLGRALGNLIENSLRFTPPGGSVVIQVIQAYASAVAGNVPPGAAITVKDSGCGIATEHVPRLFERFYQVDPSRRKGGAGLGLALVKSIMKLHRGSVCLASQPGQGTEVTLHFPR